VKRVSLSLIAIAASVSAMENPIVGPRAMGMGGAQVACAEDYNAQFYNPATFGFFNQGTPERNQDGMGRKLDGAGFDNQDLARKDWGFGIDLTAGARVNGELATYADDLLDFNTEGIDTIQADVTGNPTRAQKTITDILKLASSLGNIDIARDAATIQVNGGAGIRILSFGIGARVYTEAVAKVAKLDLTNLGSGTGNANVANLLSQAAQGTTTPTLVNAADPYTSQYFSQTQYQTLLAAIGAAAPSATADQIATAAQGIDQQAAQAQANGDIDASAAAAITDALGNGTTTGVLSALSSNGDINKNETAILIQGSQIFEVPVSYGYAFNDYVSVGGSVKYMMGKISAVKIRAIDTNSNKELSDYLQDFMDDAQESSNVGIDLGIQARYDFIQAGLVARNINGPTFKGPTVKYTRADGTVESFKVDDVQVKPDVRAGIAVIPFYQWYAGLTLAADAELIKSETALPGYYHQMVSAGAELKLLSTLDLRGGVSKNIAESDIPMLLHGGFGLNLWLLRIDAAGAMATETVTVDGDEVPKELRGSVAVATDW
jgi:hypothetical protein